MGSEVQKFNSEALHLPLSAMYSGVVQAFKLLYINACLDFSCAFFLIGQHISVHTPRDVSDYLFRVCSACYAPT